jgi:hypothetical protein
MKKIIYSFLSLFTFVVFLSSCNKDTQAIPEPKAGAMVLVESVSSSVFNASDLANAKYSGVLRDPRGNVASLEIYAKITRSSSIYSELKFVKSITNVNGNFEITAAEVVAGVATLTDTMGVGTTDDVAVPLASVSDLQPGDKIDFINRLKTTDGEEVLITDISQNLNGNEGQRSAFDFVAYVSCPFVATDMVGTYEIQALSPNFWGLASLDREVKAGPGANQITIVGGTHPALGGSEDLVVEVDPGTGIASLPTDPAPGFAFTAAVTGFDTDKYGSVSGFAFACTGLITLRVDYTAYAGNEFSFILQKK